MSLESDCSEVMKDWQLSPENATSGTTPLSKNKTALWRDQLGGRVFVKQGDGLTSSGVLHEGRILGRLLKLGPACQRHLPPIVGFDEPKQLLALGWLEGQTLQQRLAQSANYPPE